jgi:hypothetical protein
LDTQTFIAKLEAERDRLESALAALQGNTFSSIEPPPGGLFI